MLFIGALNERVWEFPIINLSIVIPVGIVSSKILSEVEIDLSVVGGVAPIRRLSSLFTM